MHIHISNLNINLIESDIQRMFTAYGEVAEVNLVRDKLNNRSTGRAFVIMPVPKEGKQAIASLHRTEMRGKTVNVAEVIYDPAPNASWTHSQDT